MARNQEKAQSTLYRFREAQAAELGIAPSSAKRPRVASRVANLRECEKWRGEVLREISRKVSKIQDFGLTDYEVRDVNDEINKLIREKGAWEHQIVSLGGANYKRGVPKMLDDAGREVPGTRGYKYFGRAKDLPGVKELLNRSVEQEAEMESYRSLKYKRFANQPLAYYGDEDEDDGLVLAAEEEAENQAWEEGRAELMEVLGEEAEDLDIPESIPRAKPKSLKELQQATSASESEAMNIDTDTLQKAAGDSTRVTAMLSVLNGEELKPPPVPDRSQVEAIILQAKKRALRQQCECYELLMCRAKFGHQLISLSFSLQILADCNIEISKAVFICHNSITVDRYRMVMMVFCCRMK
jgi:pre-mRNA-splicing factor ISY1